MIYRRPADDRAVTEAELVSAYAIADRSVPHLRVNFVTSLDGAVTVDDASAGLSGTDDKLVFGILRMLADAVLVGAGTARSEGYRGLRVSDERRAWRRAQGLADDPRLVLVSNRLGLDPAAPMLADSPVRPMVITCEKAPADRREALTGVADVIALGEDTVDAGRLPAHLAGAGLPQVLSEGGPQLFGALTAASAVDELCLSISPLLAGPGAGRITAGALTGRQAMRLHSLLCSDDGTLFSRYVRKD